MTLEEAIDELRERMIELPYNAIDFNRGYLEAIRDLEHIAEDADKEHEKLIEAARLLESNCENNDECNFMQVDCLFQTKSIYGFWTCSIEGRPSCWG